jgi:hypothetical protein
MRNIAGWMLMVVALWLLAPVSLFAQPPLVKMRVTLPDGQVREVTAPESSVARLTYDKTEYEFRPTIQDSRPWRRVVVTVFKGATATTTTQQLGDAEVQTGGSPVRTKSTPAFEVAVIEVTPAESPTSTS